MENQTQEKKTTNFAVKIRGFLGHDNDYFDRTCPACKGMHSSFITISCPKCGAALTYLTTSKNKPFAISEGTIYPVLGAQEDKDKKTIEGKKNGMIPKYRFKIFSFMENEVLAPPLEHVSMKKGALVELIIINHQLIPSWFTTKDKVPCVELLAQIYPQYGDSVKVLQGPKVAETTVSYPVNPDGSPTPLMVGGGTDTEKIALMEAEIARLKAETPATPALPNTPPPPDTTVHGADTVSGASATVGSVDPFELA